MDNQDKSNEANSKKNNITELLNNYSHTMEKLNNTKNTGKCRISVRIS
ncbi:MAG: hypothetical protein K2J90_04875 [Lachnospiraceae bacterium]|nr:hypothetical protein [Lachnospiraceae bacterium]